MKKAEIKKAITVDDFVKTAASYKYDALYFDKKGFEDSAKVNIKFYLSIRDSIIMTLYDSYTVKTMKEAEKFTDSEIKKAFLNLEKEKGFVLEANAYF